MPAGIYIHIPFCRSRCSYCDFATDVFKNEETVEHYVSALVKEIERFELSSAAVPAAVLTASRRQILRGRDARTTASETLALRYA